jgi:hypothetical protein
MIYTLVPKYNATLIESDPKRNTGADEILQLQKQSTGSSIYEQRIVLKVDTADISNVISDNSLNANNVEFRLKLFSAQVSELPFNFTVMAHPISSSWQNGSGRYFGDLVQDGVSWNTLQGAGSDNWPVGSGVTTQSYTEPGGGNWFTSIAASQSFSLGSDNTLDIDVSNIIRSYLTGSLTNEGILLRLNFTEISASTYPNTTLQFYSNNTGTVYSPQLQLFWSASTSAAGQVITYAESPVPYLINNPGTFKQNSKIRFELAARPRFPRATFSQNSAFSVSKFLPAESYYQILDAHTNEILIPYSKYTKIYSAGFSNYFEFYATMLYPERFYKFEIKSTYSELTQYYSSNDFVFKIEK